MQSLARASVAGVLKQWQGLGYNRRALNLKKCAEIVSSEYEGKLPQDPAELIKLPGIGAATSASIAAFAFNKPVVFIETNIRRVFIHHFFADRTNVSDKDLLPLIEKALDLNNPRDASDSDPTPAGTAPFSALAANGRARKSPRDASDFWRDESVKRSPRIWYWALMDYGTHLAKVTENPNRRGKHYTKQSKFEGSNRQLRGAILRLLSQSSKMSLINIQQELSLDNRIENNLNTLEQEGFIKQSNGQYQLS